MSEDDKIVDRFQRHDSIRDLIAYAGDDPQREGLLETPERYLKAMAFWCKGYDEDPGAILKTFEDGAEKYDGIVFQGGITFFSHCEHHITPFFGYAHVGYLPNGKVVGLSKLARLVDVFARRLSMQERITQQVANALHDFLEPRAVGVVIRARHLCMESRGVQRVGAFTFTSCMLGGFRDDPAMRAEFMDFVKAADANAGQV